MFREYDIRGIFEKELNEDTVKKIGFCLAKRVKGEYIAVGYDARVHSPTLFNWLVSGINKANKRVLNLGLVPTPVNYFSNYVDFDIKSKKVRPCASVMITGSHNPPEYNGFKITIDKKPFFGEDIYELGRDVLECKEVIKDSFDFIEVDVKSKYIDYMVKEFSFLKGFDKEVVADCGNGAVAVVLEPIFKALNIRYRGLFCIPDGTFPNHHPDPSVEDNLKDLKEALKKEGNIGFAYDGDGDRVAVLTKKYNIAGDILAILFAKSIKDPVVIGEVKCSKIMYDEIEKIGKAVMYKTGHSNLKVKIKELNASLAAEVSGHIFFADRYFGYDDAIYATFRVLELIYNGMDLDKEIKSLPKLYTTPEIKVETTDDKKFKVIKKLKEALKNQPKNFPQIKKIIDIDGVRIEFDEGWALVRASNTTPVLVTRFEAIDEKKAKEYQEAIMNIVNNILKEV